MTQFIRGGPRFDVAKAARPGIFVFCLRRPPLSETKIEMALHRDIYWVGRQWAVTGYGIQACDQKQKGSSISRPPGYGKTACWKACARETWLNVEDFDKALAVARARFPEQPQEVPQPEDGVLGLIEAVLKEPPPEAPSVGETGLTESGLKQTELEERCRPRCAPRRHILQPVAQPVGIGVHLDHDRADRAQHPGQPFRCQCPCHHPRPTDARGLQVQTIGAMGGMAAELVDAEVNRQALMIAYIDDFWLMMWVCVAALPFVFLLNNSRRKPSAEEMVME